MRGFSTPTRLAADGISCQTCQTDRVSADRAVCQTAVITGLGNLKFSNRQSIYRSHVRGYLIFIYLGGVSDSVNRGMSMVEGTCKPVQLDCL